MTTTAPPTTSPPQQDGRLAGNALGLPSVLFCIVTGAAPLTAMLFNVPVAVNGGGWAAPAAFGIATVALTIFSVGYIAMSRRVTARRRLLHVRQPRARPHRSASAPGC